MSRKRMINPSFWRDEKIAECTYLERLLFQGLWSFAEDNGVGRAVPRLIKADIFPYDDVSSDLIKNGLIHLNKLRLIQLYEIDGQHYYWVCNFAKHQTINRPSICYLPTLPEDGLTEDSLSTHDILTPNISKVKISKAVDETLFDEFWKLYPRTVGKELAKEKFNKVCKDDNTFIGLMKSLAWQTEEWNKAKTETKYIPHASTWLNQKRFNDDILFVKNEVIKELEGGGFRL